MDKIHIRDLSVNCVIGTRAEERTHKQQVIFNITLEADLSAAGNSDDLADTVNYKDIKDSISDLVEASEFFLIERLAQCVAELCLAAADRVVAADVMVDKPSALALTRSVAVQLRRER